MDHLTIPIDTLRAEAACFVRDEDLRLLHVVADAPLFQAALETLAAIEWVPSTDRQVFVLAPVEGAGEDRWVAWTRALLDQLGCVRAAYLDAGVTLPDTWRVQEEPGSLITFGRAVVGAERTLAPPHAPVQGIVVVLAAHGDADVAAALGHLAPAPELARVKWIWVDTSAEAGAPLLERLGHGRAASATCRIDPTLQKRDLDELFEALAAERSEAGGAPGQAWPGQPVPAHPSDPPRARGGADTRLTPEPNLSRPFLQAVAALRRGEPMKAVEIMREARDAAVAAEEAPAAVEMDLVLATILADALSREGASVAPALEILESAAARARAAGLGLPTAKCELASGALAAGAGDHARAARAYRQAATAASDAGEPALAIEALYLGGELALTGRDAFEAPRLEVVAVDVWREALEIADALTPEERKSTRAAACALRIAEVCVEHGLDGHAEAVLANAARAQGTPPPTPASGPATVARGEE